MAWDERAFFLAEQAYLQPEEQPDAARRAGQRLRQADLLLALIREEQGGKAADREKTGR